MNKRAVRQLLLDERKAMSASDRQFLSLQAQQRLLAADCFSSCGSLALYSPISNEVSTDQLFVAAHSAGRDLGCLFP